MCCCYEVRPAERCGCRTYPHHTPDCSCQNRRIARLEECIAGLRDNVRGVEDRVFRLEDKK